MPGPPQATHHAAQQAAPEFAPYVPRYADAVSAGTWATRRGRRTWPWWIAAAVLAALVAAAFYTVRSGALDELLDPAGPYTGAPVTAGDVPSPGYVMIVSPDEAVAFEAGNTWVDVPDWLGIDDPNVNFPSWSTHVGGYFLGQPGEAPIVVVLETTTEALGRGESLRAAHDFHLDWIEGVGADDPGPMTYKREGTSRIHTDNGLTGYATTYTATLFSTEFDYAVFTFMQGDRVVFVAINGVGHELDLKPYQHVLDTLRIDS